MDHTRLDISRLAGTGADIDIEALLMIARLEAAATWPDEDIQEEPPPDIPEGFDLHHWADFDWIEQRVAAATA